MAQRTTEELLEDILRQLGGSPGSAPPPPNSSNSGGGIGALGLDDFSDAIKGPKGAIKGVGKLTSAAGKAAGPIALMAEAGEKLYDYMDASLQQFKAFNTAGFDATNGMLGLNMALADGRLDFQEFQNAARGAESVLASMGKDGAKDFGNMMKSVIDTERSMGLLRMSNQEAAQAIFSNIKQQKAYGVFDKLSRIEQQNSNREYIDDLNHYSKVLGVSTDELTRKLNKSAEGATGLSMALTLHQNGLSKEDAAASVKNLNLVLAGMGDFGEAFNEQFQRFVYKGDFDADTEMGKLFTYSSEVSDAFVQIRDNILAGDLTTKEGAAKINDILGGSEFTDALSNASFIFKDLNDTSGQIFKWIADLQNKNNDLERVESNWDTWTNNLNRVFEKWTHEAKEQTASAFLNPRAFLSQWMGEDWANWLIDGSWTFATDTYDFVFNVRDFVRGLFPEWLVDVLDGKPIIDYVTGAATDLSSGPPSWRTIADALFPKWFNDFMFDGTIPDTGFEALTDSITDTISSTVNDTVNSAVATANSWLPVWAGGTPSMTPKTPKTTNTPVMSNSHVAPTTNSSTKTGYNGITQEQMNTLISSVQKTNALASEAARDRRKQLKASEDNSGPNG
ncbi:hypothetical protein NVP2275O_437 [Vibrio phage 2.275.O._10N.286.54.E11]|nr:hypothetical protein NVP2275O_437 [Vibrio phage 2.275.O._10N.286.54.E11]